MSDPITPEQPLARARTSALRKARRRLSLMAQEEGSPQSSVDMSNIPPVPPVPALPVSPTRPLPRPPPSSYRPAHGDDTEQPLPPQQPLSHPHHLHTAGDPVASLPPGASAPAVPTHPRVPSTPAASGTGLRSASMASMDPMASPAAAEVQGSSADDKPLPRIVKHQSTLVISPQPVHHSPSLLSPLDFPSSPLRAGEQRSLPPTPHTPSERATNSRPTSPSSPAGLGIGPSANGAESEASAMRRRDTGSGNGNGRLSPASAERRQFQIPPKPASSSTPLPPPTDVKRPTEQRPQTTPHHLHLMKLAQEPYLIVIGIACVGLTIVTFGWGTFFTIVALVAGPLIGRYVIPAPKATTTGADEWPPKSAQTDSVAWVNHALRTLFPMVATDVLTPFVDLLEDALMVQVPPIVTSVRISSVSLGIEPVLLTSMKSITDDEWFAALAQQGASNGTVPAQPQKSHHEHNGVPTPPPTAGVDGSYRGPANNGRTSAATSPTVPSHPASPTLWANDAPQSQPAVPGPKIIPVAPRIRSGRSISNASRNSRNSVTSDDGYVPAVVANDPAQQQLRKRDRMLSRLRRHRGHPRLDLLSTAAVSALQAPAECEVDLDADHYVNYEVGFTYRRSADMRARGSGLHMISHFGWGVRGLGGSEIPVYLDVSELRGKLRVRILLSASPPFAREISFSFVSMPHFDISARPLRSGSFNAMDIPMIKSYVEKSIAKVAGAFVSPKSYTMDVERLLMGQDSALRTHSVGVFHIIIHNAHNLPRTDTMGSCDPYLAISYSKFNKPLFSTRTIVDTTEPVWEEEAFILVSADAVSVGEKLRLRVCDSDRFSADDLVGVVEVDVADLIEYAALHPGQLPIPRQDVLQAARPGMKVQGEIEWSVRFHPLWQLPKEELQNRVEALRETRGEGSTPAPWWLSWLDEYVEIPEWEKERSKRRKEHVEMFTGERMRDEIEAAGKPQTDLPAGVLQFHIHQCSDLEVESLQGTFSGSASRRKSAAMGKPALQDVIDRGPSDNYDPPSAYCEVHLNDKFVYRTRTKQLTPVPYFNAQSERFIRDWREAKITFVIKDARDREHDPILGIVCLPLKDALKNSSQITRWYPLVGGQGWGRLRISLLFKPFDLHIPTNMSSYETATFDLTSVTTTTDLFELAGGKQPILIMESEYDRTILRCDDTPGAPTPSGTDTDHRRSNDYSDGRSTEMLVDALEGYQFSREPSQMSVLVPSPDGRGSLQHQQASPAHYGSMSRIKGSIKKRRDTLSSSLKRSDSAVPHPHAHAGEVEWHSHHVHHVARLAVQYRHSCSLVLSFVTKRVIKKRKVHAIAILRLDDCADGELLTRTVPIFATASVRDAMKAVRKYAEAQKFSGASGDRLSRELGNEIPLVGYGKVTFVLHAGLSRAHAKLAKRDLKFRSVYQAWEATRVVHDVEHLGEESECSSDSDLESESDEEAHAAAAKLKRDDTREMLQQHGSHGKALRDQNRGIFQLKLARTGKFVKDKVEAKMLSVSAGGLDRRARGMDVDVEHEGQSKL